MSDEFCSKCGWSKNWCAHESEQANEESGTSAASTPDPAEQKAREICQLATEMDGHGNVYLKGNSFASLVELLAAALREARAKCRRCAIWRALAAVDRWRGKGR